MSFLKYRLGASEGNYFKNESELKATQLKQRLQDASSDESSNERATLLTGPHEAAAAPSDTLPEILRHSLPLSSRASASLDARNPNADRSTAAAAVPRQPAQAVAHLGVIGSAAHVPQTKLGPAKYALQFPAVDQSAAALRSTANEMRPRTADKAAVEAATQGLRMVARAFGLATVGVVTVAVAGVTYTFKRLEIERVEDIPVKVQAAVQPRAERFRQRIAPVKELLHNKATEWRMQASDAEAIGGKFATVLGARKKDA